MDKVGYTVIDEPVDEITQLYESENCQAVIQADDEQDLFEQFNLFLETYKESLIVLISFESIGLQLIQLPLIFDLIEREKIQIHFVENPLNDDELYIKLLHQLSLSERSLISRRTLKGLKKAHASGIVSGRPKIAKSVADKIIYLHENERRTIREISIECGVSLGTVHKYLKMSKQ